jgi:hypothetical protein
MACRHHRRPARAAPHHRAARARTGGRRAKGEVFPHAACVVTLVDRLVHRAEVIEIEAESYRLKEAKELNARRSKQRRAKKH